MGPRCPWGDAHATVPNGASPTAGATTKPTSPNGPWSWRGLPAPPARVPTDTATPKRDRAPSQHPASQNLHPQPTMLQQGPTSRTPRCSKGARGCQEPRKQPGDTRHVCRAAVTAGDTEARAAEQRLAPRPGEEAAKRFPPPSPTTQPLRTHALVITPPPPADDPHFFQGGGGRKKKEDF